MSVETMYLAKIGAEDAYIDAATHTIPVSASVTRSVTGLAAYFYRIDGTGTAGTGNWETSGKMTASYFVATHASTPSVFPVATVSTTLNVVNASTFQVDATSLDCAVAANFTAAVALTGGGTANTWVVGTDPTGSEVLRAASTRFTNAVVVSALSVGGNTTLTGQVAAGGAVTLATTLAVVGASTMTGAVALNGGATVPSGQTLTIAAGATLTVSGTLGITTLTATTATIAGAAGGSEVLRTTTFRATGASVLVGAVSASSTLTVAGAADLQSTVAIKAATVSATGGFTNLGLANYFVLPDTADTSTATSLNLDALETPHSALFDPSAARTLASLSITGVNSGVYWFINTSGTYAVTIHADNMDTPSGTFTLAANTTALLYWDASGKKFTQIAH